MSRKQSPNEKVKTKPSPANNTDEKRYCICQKREDELNNEDEDDFMIECDGCNGWFHGKCIGLADRIADDIEKYFCADCSNEYGPSIFKPRRNQHRRDFSDSNATDKPTQSGTQDFITKLKRKVFPSSEPVITRLKGNQVTSEYFYETGFTKPILVTNRDGLELTLPSRTISLAEINELVGEDRSIDIIDCEKQVTYKMSLTDYIEYFESFERQKIYNVLSLEISNTKLGEQVVTPRIVRDLSWATIGIWPEKKKDENHDDETKLKKAAWPIQTFTKKKRRTVSSSDTDLSDDEQFKTIDANHFENFQRPEVAKYCLISPQSSYTDFHVDFGGSSVWYSVVRGEKIFYIIEPTDENLQKYSEWSRSPTESETFLGDCVSHCYKMHLKEENTVFIPAGWIHAVYTVTDSLVFGGNFLHSMHVDMQLRIYELERLAQVPNKFQFPLFETFHWYATRTFYEELKECNEAKSLTINPIIQQACESILHYMNKWLSTDKRYQIRNRLTIPTGINCEKLLRDLAREFDIAKTRCGLSNIPKISTINNFTNSIKLTVPCESKQELVQFNDRKIKVKCSRLSIETEQMKNKDTSNINGMKVTIKKTLSGCRKPNNNQDLSSTTMKKKSIKQQKSDITIKVEQSSRPSYTLDLEAKRQRFIDSSNNPTNHNALEKDSKISSISKVVKNDLNESHDHNESLESIAVGGLSSFIKSSSINNDYCNVNKESKIKREHSLVDSKIPKKKFKSKLPINPEKLDKITKKIKTDNTSPSNPIGKKSSTNPIKKPSSSSTSSSSSLINQNGTPINKKRLSSSTPKLNNSKDRLGKILKIANSIKSRGGILT